MNAVLKTSAAEDLAAFRARMRELDRQAEPLRGQVLGLETNIGAAVEEYQGAVGELEALRRGSSRDYPAIAAKEAEVNTRGARLENLRDALTVQQARLGEMEARHAKEAAAGPPLEVALLNERMTELVERRRATRRALDAIEDEIEACAHANDAMVDTYVLQHGQFAPGMLRLVQDLRVLRGHEQSIERNARLVDKPRPHIQARAQELRREIEQS